VTCARVRRERRQVAAWLRRLADTAPDAARPALQAAADHVLLGLHLDAPTTDRRLVGVPAADLGRRPS